VVRMSRGRPYLLLEVAYRLRDSLTYNIHLEGGVKAIYLRNTRLLSQVGEVMLMSRVLPCQACLKPNGYICAVSVEREDTFESWKSLAQIW
jgi:hypothetical protein